MHTNRVACGVLDECRNDLSKASHLPFKQAPLGVNVQSRQAVGLVAEGDHMRHVIEETTAVQGPAGQQHGG